jgi:hypothetical protein
MRGAQITIALNFLAGHVQAELVDGSWPRCAQPIRSVNEGVGEQSGAPPVTLLLH